MTKMMMDIILYSVIIGYRSFDSNGDRKATTRRVLLTPNCNYLFAKNVLF